jgi:hypothetical protein
MKSIHGSHSFNKVKQEIEQSHESFQVHSTDLIEGVRNFEDEPNNENSEGNGGNEFTPEEDENSIDDVSNKSVGIPDE